MNKMYRNIIDFVILLLMWNNLTQIYYILISARKDNKPFLNWKFPEKEGCRISRANLFKRLSRSKLISAFHDALLSSFGSPEIRRIHFLLGLWGELSGHHITFICPSETIRGIDDPTSIMQYWDDAIKHIYHLRGRSLEDGRRQVIVFDEQPSIGTFL